MNAANTSRNPFSVSRGTFVAENPCNHWRSAETAARWGSTWQGVKRLTAAPGSLSAAITAANQWAGTGLWVGAGFSLLLALILSLILVINSLASLCHSRRLLARLDDTFRRCSSIHIVATQLERINAATVCINQRGHGLRHLASHGLRHLVAAQFLTFSSPTVYITQAAKMSF